MKALNKNERGAREIVRIATLFVFATLLLSTPLAHAVPVTIEISGEVTSVGGDTGSIPSTIYAGVNFGGTYTYDSSASDSDSGSMRGLYKHDSPYGLSIVMGGYEFKTVTSHTGQFEMWIINDDPTNELHDYYIVFSNENISTPYPGFNIGSIRWDLRDSTYDALSSDALPLTSPVLTNWDYNKLTISGSGEHGLSIYGIVTQTVLVPEPFTITLMAMGIFFSRRRR